MESRPFAAICFCNRAAAHQALGQIADAIADCSLAIALDRNYSKVGTKFVFAGIGMHLTDQLIFYPFY